MLIESQFACYCVGCSVNPFVMRVSDDEMFFDDEGNFDDNDDEGKRHGLVHRKQFAPRDYAMYVA